jgi:NAD(P)-dependent dehydrogenase (short-subunit alcohol dehydrogenase family)
VADLKPSRLAGQVVLITGAESGIGRETALRAASEGADIAAVGLDSSGLDSLVEQVLAMGRRAAARSADVSDAVAVTAAVDELVSDLGSLRVAHANAGVLMQATTITDLDLDEWKCATTSSTFAVSWRNPFSLLCRRTLSTPSASPCDRSQPSSRECSACVAISSCR